MMADSVGIVVRQQIVARLRNLWLGVTISKGEKRVLIESKIRALESQDKYCPPEKLAELKRELDALK
jgi:hypothetical protein